MYHSEEFNRSCLWSWEKKVLGKYFQKCKYLLVVGAGGGREVLELRRLGNSVDGFECSPSLVKHANNLLKEQGFAPDIRLVSQDECPDSTNVYDGIIVGWAVYALIYGRKKSISFLKKLRNQTQTGSPILLSFFFYSKGGFRFKIITAIGNTIRWILRKELLELGDNLFRSHYIHHFTKERIASDLQEAGFKLIFYSTEEYGHAIGIAF